MELLTFDCGVKNCGYAYFKDSILTNFGLLDFSTFPKCKVCDKPSISLNFETQEPVYCCKGHMKEFKCKKIKTLSSQQICKNLIKSLDKLDFINKINVVIIENQPSFKNAISKSIQIMLLSYFTNKNISVYFQNPIQKFFNYKFEKNNDKYKNRKNLSVYLVKNIIDENLFKQLLSETKADDICDAILIGFAFLNNADIKNKITDIIKKYFNLK